RDRDTILLHRLQQRRLGAGARAIDLIGHQQLREDRSLHEAVAALAIGADIADLRAEAVRWQEVGRGLDAACIEPEHAAHRLHQLGLGQSWHAHEQTMAAGEDRYQGPCDHRLLAIDDLADGASCLTDAGHGPLRLGHDGLVACFRGLLDCAHGLFRRIGPTMLTRASRRIARFRRWQMACRRIASSPALREDTRVEGGRDSHRTDRAATQLIGIGWAKRGENMTFQLRHAVLAAAGQGGPSGDDHGNVKPPGRAPAPALAALFARAGKAPGRPPLERWNPPFGGDIDITIDADGTWSYLGSPIRRPELVRLFASVLVREGGAYFLLTPAEKLRISVAAVPFIAVELARDEAAARPAL